MKTEISKSVDANTGETVSKCLISQDYREALDKVLNKHNANLNNFMILSQQHADFTTKWLKLHEKIVSSNGDFVVKMKYIAKKMKLSESEPWTYNMADKCFEMREPPPMEPMTASKVNSEQPEVTSAT